jgi:hypothetical protein
MYLDDERRDRTNLVFNVAAVAPLVDLDMERVGPIEKGKLGDVKFAGVPGTLRVSNLMAVEPHGKRRVHPFEAQPQLVIFVIGTQVERGGISSTLVVVDWYAGRVDGKGEVNVGVLRSLSKALALPHARDLDAAPVGVLPQGGMVLLVEVSGAQKGGRGQVEAPVGREQLALGPGHIAREGIGPMLVQEEVAARRERVPVDDLEVIPVWA